jgi:hypothetical protein
MKMSEKLGHNVIGVTQRVPSYVRINFSKNYVKNKEAVITVLQNAKRPMNISEIQRTSGIKHWSAVKLILTELAVAGKTNCFWSGRALLFQLKKEYRNPTPVPVNASTEVK